MILFIHGIQQSAGVFLPLIKAMVGDHNDLDDKFLLDSFCLWLPGYDKKDRDFNYKYIENEIYSFMVDKKEIQAEIASRLMFSNTNLQVQIIKESKLNLIGCDVGAGLALDFTAHNPEIVSSVVMMDCGSDFNNLRSKWMQLRVNRLIQQPSNIIARRYETETDIYKKIFLSSIANYPALKGIKSYLELFRNYNFGSTFDKISIDQQTELSHIKILNFVDKKFGLSNNFSTKKLQTILDKKFKTVTKRGIFIKSQSHKNFHIQPIAIGTKSILNHQVANNICDKLKVFYNP
jgi:hypothetical protein